MVTRLANDIMVADNDFRVASAVADVLRLAADDGVGIDVVVAADGDIAHQRDVVFQPGAATDARLGPDDAERDRSRLRRRFRRGDRSKCFRRNRLPWARLLHAGMREATSVAGCSSRCRGCDRRPKSPSGVRQAQRSNVFRWFVFGGDGAHQLGVEPVSASVGDESPDEVATDQGKVADHIDHLVPHAFIGKPQLVVDRPARAEDQQVFEGRSLAEPQGFDRIRPPTATEMSGWEPS